MSMTYMKINQVILSNIKIKQKLNLYKNTLVLISNLPDVRIDEAQVIAKQALIQIKKMEKNYYD